MRLQVNERFFVLLLLIAFTLCPMAIAQENQATLRVSLPAGTTIGPSPDPWLNEGWLLNLTGTSWTFTVRVSQTHDVQASYDTHLVVALNDGAYNNLVSLTINSITMPKAVFRNGTPTPYNIWTWPDDVYPTWFNDTCVSLGTIYPEEYIDLTVCVTVSNTTNVRMHFDAYGKTIPCTTPPKLGEITWSPHSGDSTVLSTPDIPVAKFNYTPIVPVVNETVIFNASDSYDPDGRIVSYEWDFSDGNVTTTTNPIITHIYTAIGNYTVTLTVTDNDAKSTSTSAMVSVIKYPIANFTYSPETPLVGQSVTFNATLSTPNGGYLVNYVWDFGDSTPIAVEPDPIKDHVYSDLGTYNVTLTVTDSEGLNDAKYKTIEVVGRPKANFCYSPSYPIVGQIVIFNASASTPDGGYITNYTWDFGDGNITAVTGPIVTHRYTMAGTYNVTLSVEDSESLTDVTWKTLFVRANPHAVFTYSPSAPQVDETVTFDASTSEPNGGIIIWYYWNFGDGNTANETDSSTTHIYSVAERYNVTLTVTDSEGLTDITWEIITIVSLEPPEPPHASFTKSPQIPYVGQLVTFDASLSESGFDGVNLCPIVWYYWHFGDGATANETDPITTHTYSKAGTYNVTLTVYAPARGSPEYHPYDSAWQTITVSVPVGGYAVAINKRGLMIRWIGSASLVILAIVLTAIFVKRRSKTVTRYFAAQ